MRNLRIVLLTIYFFIGILVPSCEWVEDPDCNCGSTRFFNVMDLRVDPLMDFDSFTRIQAGEEVRLSEFAGYYVDYEVDYHACAQPESNWSLSTMSTAWACSCAVGIDGSKNEELVEFTVRTVDDFDADHLAGSSINDLLQYRGNFWDQDDQPLVDFLGEEQMGKMRFEDMRLGLTKAPDLESQLQVEIRMELSTGEVYEVTSATIVLLP